MSEGAFVRAFRKEMELASFESYVEQYIWANSTGYGQQEELRPAAEAFARHILHMEEDEDA